MHSSVSVRIATKTDFGAIAEIGNDIFSKLDNRAQFNWPEQLLAHELEHVKTLILEYEGELVSFLCYRDLPDIYEISVLATRPSAQKKYFQTTLIQNLQRLAARQRRAILLEVHRGNSKAIALYQKMSFITLHTRKQYYADKADALIMKWNDDKAGC